MEMPGQFSDDEVNHISLQQNNLEGNDIPKIYKELYEIPAYNQENFYDNAPQQTHMDPSDMTYEESALSDTDYLHQMKLG